MKKKIAVVMIILSFVFAVAFGCNDKLSAPKDFAVNHTGLSWSAVAGADGYELAISDTIVSIKSTSIDFSDSSINSCLAKGKNFARVRAIKNDTKGEYTEKIDFIYRQALEAPVVALSGSECSWNHVDGAVGYIVKLNEIEMETITVNRYSLLDLTKDYVISVKAVGRMEEFFADSEYSATVNYIAPLQKLDIPKLSFNINTVSWNSVNNADGYVIKKSATGEEQSLGALTSYVFTQQQDTVFFVKAVSFKPKFIESDWASIEISFEKPKPDIIVSNLSFVYNGAPQSPSASANGLILAVQYSFDDGSTFTDNIPVNAGNYKVRFSFDGNNEFAACSVVQDFIISPKPITVANESLSKVYDGLLTFTQNLSLNGVASNDIVTVSGSFEDKNAGDNKKIIFKLTDNLNYIITGNYLGSILPKNVSVIWSNDALIYNGNPQKPSAHILTGVNGEEIDIAVFTNSPCINAATGYSASAQPITNNPNYNVSNTDFIFEIQKKVITFDGFSYNDKRIIFDGNMHFLDAENYPEGLEPIYTLYGSEFYGVSEIGSYEISLIFRLIDEENYSYTSQDFMATLTIYIEIL